MKPIKNVIVTFRIDEETKKELDKIATEKEWSMSQLISKIIKEWIETKK